MESKKRGCPEDETFSNINKKLPGAARVEPGKRELYRVEEGVAEVNFGWFPLALKVSL